jgi:thiamine biosynthesis lipoprotein
MGTLIVVEFWFEAKASEARACQAAVFSEMHRIDDELSPYKPESELTVVNSRAANQAVKISKELYVLLEKSLEMSRLSQGAFDISFASIGFRYDYRNSKKPSEKEISSLINAVNYRKIILDPGAQTVRFTDKKVKIDLGGIAKGYAVDNGIAILQKCGIRHALVSAGGDSRVIGDRGGRPWMIGIKHPRKADGVVTALPLVDSAFSTSGDYERYFIQDGVRYHHIINPKSGKSAKSVMSVTILGKDAVTTDALSTTVFIMGVEKGLALIETMADTDAVIIDAQGKMHFSSGLEPARDRRH